ncbi:unnamed protein product, partial [Adineta ricciae]
MQLAMYQMLTNLSSNSTPPAIPPLRFRPVTENASPIITHPKPLKRLTHKRPRPVKTTPTGSGTATTSSINMPTSTSSPDA